MNFNSNKEVTITITDVRTNKLLFDGIIGTDDVEFIPQKKFTLIEVLTEIDGYLDDCRKDNVHHQQRIYSNGLDSIKLYYSGMVISTKNSFQDLNEREWFLDN